jgi:GTPase SAR1 family protein
MKNLSVAVLGRTGDGKSTLLNTMLQNDIFHHAVSKRRMSTTIRAESNKGLWLGKDNNVTLTCIDTPGILDEEHVTLLNESQLSSNIEGFFRNVCPGVNAFILVFNIEDFSFNDQTIGILTILADVLSPEFWKHLIIVFTHCDPDSTTWRDKKDKYIKEIPVLFKDSFGVVGIPQFYLSSKSTDGFQDLFSEISKRDPFDSTVLKRLNELIKEGDKDKTDKYLYEIISKAITHLIKCNTQ